MAVFSLIGSIVSSVAGSLGAVGATTAAAAGAGGGVASALGGLGTFAGLAGAGIQAYGSMQAAKGAARAESLRERQMNLQAARERRNTVRQATVARAQALNQGVAQGAGGSSGLLGGLGQITAEGTSTVQGINQGQQLGQQMFAANRQISQGQTYQSIGGGLQSLGSYMGEFSNYARAF